MKNFFILIFCVSILFPSCKKSHDLLSKDEVGSALSVAYQQYTLMAETLINDEDKLPRTIGDDGLLKTSLSKWWTSGFFPGTLWYLYEDSGNPDMRMYAENFTNRLENEQFMTHNHDIGFILNCSYGNGYRLTRNLSYKDIMLQGAESLSTRYNPIPNSIRSWDWNKNVWQYPVIIDNMMNLELLTWADKNSDEPRYMQIARAHADRTKENHFRPNYSCYHVVSYDTLTGEPEKKMTYQGYNHESAWARGQGWALYGYTMMFRETGDSAYLEQAHHIARFILDHPRLPEDKVPYWDFDDPSIPDALRDASSGSVIASALLELSQYSNPSEKSEYISIASTILRTLSGPEYLAGIGENCNFILKHSVGNKPTGDEIDAPLTYADYYYVEALLRYKKYVLGEDLLIHNSFTSN